jgi:hypothetical protein
VKVAYCRPVMSRDAVLLMTRMHIPWQSSCAAAHAAATPTHPPTHIAAKSRLSSYSRCLRRSSDATDHAVSLSVCMRHITPSYCSQVAFQTSSLAKFIGMQARLIIRSMSSNIRGRGGFQTPRASQETSAVGAQPASVRISYFGSLYS